MTPVRTMSSEISNILTHGDLTFSDFVELALYHPEFGYYAKPENRIGKEGDFVTAPLLSPAFGFAMSRLAGEFLGGMSDDVSTIVDVGCGDGELILNMAAADSTGRARFFGVDRSLERVSSAASETEVAFVRTLDEVPQQGPRLIVSNELFDALPFSRLVQRGEHLHELWVTERNGDLDWQEHEAPGAWEDYFAMREIELEDGQFADVSMEWEAYYTDLCRTTPRGLIVTLDYGYPEKQLFHGRVRRFGTAAAYSQQRVTRDLLRDPGTHDITAHINFSDLIRAGERAGFDTLFFDRQAKFLLALGITEHELFRPAGDVSIDSVAEGVDLIQRREDARRLVLPDGIGEDIRVLVQAKGIALNGWTFQRKLF
ncbi:MAG: SAM-dependent methyltransferase [Thermoanaerobaculia bacterium]|nr:SAM-dependent methyltransferase [Thermoanaerobaculia bacterium]